MHRLAPAPAVARATQPLSPERHGGVELRSDISIGIRHWYLVRVELVEHERGRLPGADCDSGADVAAVDDLERTSRRETEPQPRRTEERPVRGERDFVAGARVVEAGRDVHAEAHLPAHGKYPPDHAVAMRDLARARHGHEVLHLPHAVRHQEARDQHVGVRKVELLRAPAVPVGRDTEQAAAVGVEERREDTRRVETRAAVPVDRSVRPDERDRVQIADQAVLSDRQVARPRCLPHGPGHEPVLSARIGIEHHQRASSSAQGTSTSLPLDAERSSSSWARRASDSGRRSATTGWILSARSSSSRAAKSSRNHSG